MNQVSSEQNTLSRTPHTGWSIWILTLLQLIGVALVIYYYALEPGLHLGKLSLILIGSFLIQPLVPYKSRTWLFILVSILGLFFFTGWLQSIIIVGYALGIILSARYVTSPLLRYSLVGALSVGLILLFSFKSTWATENSMVFGILGSMFMFRLSIYLYDRHHLSDKTALDTDLAYFFMLPNMAILLFPAVDYKTWRHARLDQDVIQTYKKGVQWIVMGVFHLVLYRAIYYYALKPASEVRDLLDFTHYAFTNYLLIIRLSGIFHIAVGTLCLFGFNLPQAFNNYFLASGFSDLWRRINIYFREYLIKVFYYPIFFRLRKHGTSYAMAITIMVLFLITWLLHSFQWFWLKGHFPLKATDVIFWGIFGVLVTINALLEIRKKRIVHLASPRRRAIISTARIIGMMLFMSVLWSLWSANSVQEWLVPVRQISHSPLGQWGILFVFLCAVWLLGSVIYHLIERYALSEIFNPPANTPLASFWSIAMLTIMGLLHLSPVQTLLKNQWNIDPSGVLTSKLNASDELQRIEGYYSEILIGNELTSPLSQVVQPAAERITETDAKRFTGDFRHKAIEPNIKTTFKGYPFTTNRWGMRDRDYSLTPGPNTKRFILMGGSIVVGSGIADEDVFNRRLETLMNTSHPEINHEFMNFGCASYDLIDCILQFEFEKLDRFQADYLLFFSHGIEIQKSIRDLAKSIKEDIPIPYEYLNKIIREAQISKEMPIQEIEIRLEPFGKEIITRSCKYLFELCQTHHIQPVWVFWSPIARQEDALIEKSFSMKTAADAGFLTIDLTHVYDAYPLEEITVSAFDMHPNALGHTLVAEALFKIFITGFLYNDPANQ